MVLFHDDDDEKEDEEQVRKNEVDRTQSRNENRGRSMRRRKKIVPSSPIIRKLFFTDTRDMGKNRTSQRRKE